MYATKQPTAKQLENEKALMIYAVFLCCLILSIAAARWLYRYIVCNKTPGSLPCGATRYFGRRALLLVSR